MQHSIVCNRKASLSDWTTKIMYYALSSEINKTSIYLNSGDVCQEFGYSLNEMMLSYYIHTYCYSFSKRKLLKVENNNGTVFSSK